MVVSQVETIMSALRVMPLRVCSQVCTEMSYMIEYRVSCSEGLIEYMDAASRV